MVRPAWVLSRRQHVVAANRSARLSARSPARWGTCTSRNVSILHATQRRWANACWRRKRRPETVLSLRPRESPPKQSLRQGVALGNPRPRPRVVPRHPFRTANASWRSEEHTSELQSPKDLVCRLLLEKK